jgi:hypothetical protein
MMREECVLGLAGLTLFGALFAGPACATPLMAEPAIASDGGFITFEVENDFFAKFANTDRHYTNGIRASWLSAPTDDLPDWLKTVSAPPLFGFFTDDTNVTGVSRRVGVALSQEMFTPDDTDATAPIRNDRPYAAWLHTAFSLESVRTNDLGDTWQDQWKLDLGVIGPAALGRETQNTWHSIIRTEQSNGWANQLRDEPTVNVSFERAWRSSLFRTPQMFGLATDIIPYGTLAAGNALTYAGAGGVWRIGPTLPDDFGPPRIYPGTGGSEWFHASTCFDWYLFTGVEGRAVARDIFLDGNTFRDSLSVDKKPIVGDFKLGAVAVFGSARLSFTHDFRTREFYGQPKIDQFGSIVLGFAL